MKEKTIVNKVSDAGKYLIPAGLLTTVAMYFWDIPEEVASAISVLLMMSINLCAVVVMDILKKKGFM